MSAISSLITLAGICALTVLIYGPWQDVCTAFARQVIFEKRDAIFDLAASGKLSFADADYRTIRAMLEKSIRFAHEVTIPRLLFYYTVLRWQGKTLGDKPELIKAVERIRDLQVRGEVQKLVMESLDAMVIMAIAKSPIALFILIPLYLFAIVAHIGRTFVRTMRDNSQALIQIEAERVGSSLDSAMA
jgi:hypothetical protein